MALDYRILKGDALRAVIDEMAALRIRVFADYPYCYVGSKAYEARYLRHYENSESAILVASYDDDKIVGMSTGTALEDHADGFQDGFVKSGIAPETVFYCAESVLLPQYRGQGAGRVFFEMREAHARKLGRNYSTFCGVVRADNDPRRPADYLPLDGFWQRIGYRKLDGVIANFDWAESENDEDISHQMQFWLKEL